MTDRNPLRQVTDRHLSRIHFLECMDQINQIIHQSDDVERMLWEVLERAFSIFGCDRIWLFHPCDPDARTYRIPVEITRKEYPGAHALNIEVPMKPMGDLFCAKALATPGPVFYGPETDPPIFPELTAQFRVRSQLSMAIYPRTGKPWMIGMHQCSHPREWTQDEQKLFESIGRRIGEGLSTLLLLRDLRESQERFDLAVRGSGEGLWDWPDTTDEGMWWSPRTYELFDCPPDEVAPSLSLWSALIHPEDRTRVKEALTRHLDEAGAPFDVQFRLAPRDEREVWIWARGQSMSTGDGAVRRMSGSFQDITEHKNTEEELRRYRAHLEELVEERTVDLKRANARLEVANRDLEAFSYSVSHDLRSPLTSIIGFAEQLAYRHAARLDAQASDMLEEIVTQGEKMRCLIDDLLALAQLGHLRRPSEPESSEEVLSEVLAGLGEDFPDIRLRVRVRDSLPPLRFPRTLLTQIFVNLVGNALRHGGTYRGPVEVGAKRLCDRVRISVVDHGNGIPEAERSRVFDPFYRGTTGNKEGTGVGLAIIAKIATCYGGTAWLEETPGGGCTFHVELVDE